MQEPPNYNEHVPPTPTERSRLQVVLFSGGRGSGALTGQLVANPGIALVLAINGYGDGASTGEVRRFLGDRLGPVRFSEEWPPAGAAC